MDALTTHRRRGGLRIVVLILVTLTVVVGTVLAARMTMAAHRPDASTVELPEPETGGGETLGQGEAQGNGVIREWAPRTTGRIEISATCTGAGDLVVRSETGERLSRFGCFDGGVNGYSATAPQPQGAFTVEAPDHLRWIIVVAVAPPGR